MVYQNYFLSAVPVQFQYSVLHYFSSTSTSKCAAVLQLISSSTLYCKLLQYQYQYNGTVLVLHLPRSELDETMVHLPQTIAG